MPSAAPSSRTLPDAGAVVLSPVAPPAKRVGQDARLALRACELSIEEANRRLMTSRAIYSGVRTRYAR